MIFTTKQLEMAVQYWGKNGDGAVSGEVISRQASKLVDVWATMLYLRHETVDLSNDPLRRDLVDKALQARGELSADALLA